MNYEVDGYGYDPESMGFGSSFDVAEPKEPIPVDRSSAIGIARSDLWRNASPQQRRATVDKAFGRIVEHSEADKSRKINFGGGETPLFNPAGGWTIAGKEWLQQQRMFLEAAAEDETGGVQFNEFSQDVEVAPHLAPLLERQKKQRGPLDDLQGFVQERRKFDTDHGKASLTFREWVDWKNAATKDESAKIDPENKEIQKEFAEKIREIDYNPFFMGDLVGEMVNGKISINPYNYHEIDKVEDFIKNNENLNDSEKKLSLIDYRSRIESVIGSLVNNATQADAGIIGSYFSSPLSDEFRKAAETPGFSGYEFLKANKHRFEKDDSIPNEFIQTFTDAVISLTTGAMFLSGKLAGKMGGDEAERILSLPAEAHGWRHEQRMKGFEDYTAFSIGNIDITRRDLTELAGQVGSFALMGGLGRAGVAGLTKAGIPAKSASDAMRGWAAGTAAKSADDVAALATTNVEKTVKALGVKGWDVVKAAGLDATAYAAGLQAGGMSFGRTHAQIMEQTGDADEAFREASLQGVADSISAFVATTVMNRFGLGAEALFGGTGPRAGGGLIQNIRSRTINAETRKATQEALKDIAEGDKKFFRQIAKDHVASVNARAKAMGLRGWGVVGGTISEGIEEMMDEVISTAIMAMHQDSQSWSDEFWGDIHDNWQNYVKAGILGAIGGTMGSAQNVIGSPVQTFGGLAEGNAQEALQKFHQQSAKGLRALHENKDAVVFGAQAQKFSDYMASDVSVKEKSQTIIDEAASQFRQLQGKLVPEGTVAAREAAKAAAGTQSPTAAPDAATPTGSEQKGPSPLEQAFPGTKWKKDVPFFDGETTATHKDATYTEVNVKGKEDSGDETTVLIKKTVNGESTYLDLATANAELKAIPKGFKLGKHPAAALRSKVDSALKRQQGKTDPYAKWKEQGAAVDENPIQQPVASAANPAAPAPAKANSPSAAPAASPAQPPSGPSASPPVAAAVDQDALDTAEALSLERQMRAKEQEIAKIKSKYGKDAAPEEEAQLKDLQDRREAQREKTNKRKAEEAADPALAPAKEPAAAEVVAEAAPATKVENKTSTPFGKDLASKLERNEEAKNAMAAGVRIVVVNSVEQLIEATGAESVRDSATTDGFKAAAYTNPKTGEEVIVVHSNLSESSDVLLSETISHEVLHLAESRFQKTKEGKALYLDAASVFDKSSKDYDKALNDFMAKEYKGFEKLSTQSKLAEAVRAFNQGKLGKFKSDNPFNGFMKYLKAFLDYVGKKYPASSALGKYIAGVEADYLKMSGKQATAPLAPTTPTPAVDPLDSLIAELEKEIEEESTQEESKEPDSDKKEEALPVNLPPTEKAAVEVAEEVLTDEDKARFSESIGEKSWTKNTAVRFVGMMNDWVASGQKAFGKMTSLFKKVWAKIKKNAGKASVIISVSSMMGISPTANIDTLRDNRSDITTSAPANHPGFIGNPTDYVDTPMDAETKAILQHGAAYVYDVEQAVNITIAETPAGKIDPNINPDPAKKADLKGATLSSHAQRMANWVVANGDNAGKMFVIADKKAGTASFFDKNGVLIRHVPALYGKTIGDFTTAEILAKSTHVVSNAEKITPSGRFETWNKVSTTGNGIVAVYREGDRSNLAFHKVYLKKPEEQREQRLATPTGEDNRVTHGCINLTLKDAKELIPLMDGGSVTYILPETKEGVESFKGFEEIIVNEAGSNPLSALLLSLAMLAKARRNNGSTKKDVAAEVEKLIAESNLSNEQKNAARSRIGLAIEQTTWEESKPQPKPTNEKQSETDKQADKAKGQVRPQVAKTDTAPQELTSEEKAKIKGAMAGSQVKAPYKVVDVLPQRVTGSKTRSTHGDESTGVVFDDKGTIYITREALAGRKLEKGLREAFAERSNFSKGNVNAPSLATAKTDTPANIADEGSYVVAEKDLPAGNETKGSEEKGFWKKSTVEGVDVFIFTPPSGQELDMAPGDLVLIAGNKSEVLVLENAFEDLTRRSQTRPNPDSPSDVGNKLQSSYRFRKVAVNLGQSGIVGPGSLPAHLQDRLNKINDRFWRSTLSTVATAFSGKAGSLMDGTISEKDVEALLDQVVAIVAPGLTKDKLVKETFDKGTKGYMHYSKADGKVHVDVAKLKEQLTGRFSNKHFQNLKGNNPMVAKLVSMEVAQMLGTLVNEEGIHLATAKVFDDQYLSDFYDQLATQELEGEFFRDLMKQIIFDRNPGLFPDAENYKGVDLGAIDKLIAAEQAKKDAVEEMDDADSLEIFDKATVKIGKLADIKIDMAMELVRAAYQLVHTGTTTEWTAAGVFELFQAMSADVDAKGPVKGFLQTLARLVKRYAQRIRMVLGMRYHQGHLPGSWIATDLQREGQQQPGFQDMMAQLHTAYMEEGFQGDTEQIQFGAVERSQDIVEFTYSRMMQELGHIGRMNYEALAKLRTLPERIYSTATQTKLEDILQVVPGTMQLDLSEEARDFMAKEGMQRELSEIDAVLDILNDEKLNGDTSYGKAMRHASLLKEVMDMRIAMLDFNPTSIFDLDTTLPSNLGDARLRVMAEIVQGMPKTQNQNNVLSLEYEARAAEVEQQIKFMENAIYGTLQNETYNLNLTLPSGMKRLMEIARGVVGLDASFYRGLVGEKRQEAVQVALEDLRSKILQKLDIERGLAPMYKASRDVLGGFKTEQSLVPAKMESLTALREKLDELKYMAAGMRQIGQIESDDAVLRDRAEGLERLAKEIDDTSPREAEVYRMQAQITRARIGVDEAKASRRYRDFKAYIDATNEFNLAVKHVAQTAIGQEYKDPSGYGLFGTNMRSDGRAEGIAFDSAGRPVGVQEITKLTSLALDSAPDESFLGDVLPRGSKAIPSDDPREGVSLDYFGKAAEGRADDGDWIEATPEEVKLREDYRSVGEATAAFFGRESYRTALRDFISGRIGAQDDFVTYFETAGLNLAFEIEEESQRKKYEPMEDIFTKMPGFGKIYDLRTEMGIVAGKKDSTGKVPSLPNGRTPEMVARDLVAWSQAARKWIKDIERVTKDVPHQIGKETTLGHRISRLFNGNFTAKNFKTESVLSQAKKAINAFDRAVFDAMQYGFVGRDHATAEYDPETGEMTHPGNMIISDVVAVKDWRALLLPLGSDLRKLYYPTGGFFLESIRAAGAHAHIVGKALKEFNRSDLRENVRKEIQRTIEDPSYEPDHKDFEAVRESPLDLSMFNQMMFFLRYFEKQSSYFVGPMWAYEGLAELEAANRDAGGEPFIAMRPETKRELKRFDSEQEAFDRAEQGDDPSPYTMNLPVSQELIPYGEVQQRDRLGPDNRPEAGFDGGETGNTREAWNEQLVAPGRGDTDSYTTPASRDARNRARVENTRRATVTKQLMFLGYHSNGERSADAAERFTHDAMAHTHREIPASKLASPLNLVRRGLMGAFPAVKDISAIEEGFLAEYAVYTTLEGMRESPSTTRLGSVANDGRVDPETLAMDLLRFKTKFEQEIIEQARVKRGEDIALAHNALLSMATQGQWNQGIGDRSRNLLKESEKFIANMVKERERFAQLGLSSAEVLKQSEALEAKIAKFHKDNQDFSAKKRERVEKLKKAWEDLDDNPFGDSNQKAKARLEYEAAMEELHPNQKELDKLFEEKARIGRMLNVVNSTEATTSIQKIVEGWQASNKKTSVAITEDQAFELVNFIQQAYLHGDGTLPIYDVRKATWSSWGYLSDDPVLSNLLESLSTERLIKDENGIVVETVPVQTIIISPDQNYLSKHGKALDASGLDLTFIPGSGRMPNVIYAPQRQAGKKLAGGQKAALTARALLYHAENSPESARTVLEMGQKIRDTMFQALDFSYVLRNGRAEVSMLARYDEAAKNDPNIKELLAGAKEKQRAAMEEAIERHMRQLARLSHIMRITRRTAHVHSFYPDSDPKLIESVALVSQLLSDREFKTFFDHAMMEEVNQQEFGLPAHTAESFLRGIQSVGVGSLEDGDVESLDVGPEDLRNAELHREVQTVEDTLMDDEADPVKERTDKNEFFDMLFGKMDWSGTPFEEASDIDSIPEQIRENVTPSTMGLARYLKAIAEENEGSITDEQAEAYAVSDATRYLYNGLASILEGAKLGNWEVDPAIMQSRMGLAKKDSKGKSIGRTTTKALLMDAAMSDDRAAPVFGHEAAFGQNEAHWAYVGEVRNLSYPRAAGHNPAKAAMDQTRMANIAATIVAKLTDVLPSIDGKAKESVAKAEATDNYNRRVMEWTTLDDARIAELDKLLPEVPVEQEDGSYKMTGMISARIAEKRKDNDSLLKDIQDTIREHNRLREEFITMPVSALPSEFSAEELAKIDSQRIREALSSWFVGEVNAMLGGERDSFSLVESISEKTAPQPQGGTQAAFSVAKKAAKETASKIAGKRSEISFDRYKSILQEYRNDFGRAELSDDFSVTSDLLRELRAEANSINGLIKSFAQFVRAEVSSKVKDPSVAEKLESNLRLPLLKIESFDQAWDISRFERDFNKATSEARIRGVLSAILSERIVGEFASVSLDGLTQQTGARSGKKRQLAELKGKEKLANHRARIRRTLMGWAFEVSRNGSISEGQVMEALNDGFGLRQQMMDEGKVVPFDFVDALFGAAALSETEAQRMMNDALDPDALSTLRSLTARMLELDKHLATAKRELGRRHAEIQQDTYIGNYYHPFRADGKASKVKAEMIFRSPLGLPGLDANEKMVTAKQAWAKTTPEQRMDWWAVSHGAIEAMKHYGEQRVDDVYKALRGHPDSSIRDFDPVKMLERAVRIVDSENAVMKERMNEAKTVAEQAQERGMTLDAATMVADPALMETYQRGKSGRMKRFALPKNFRDRREHIGRLFNEVGPDGEMVPVVFVSRSAREDLMKYFPRITKRNVESELSNSIHRAAGLGQNAPVMDEVHSFFLEQTAAVANEDFKVSDQDFEDGLSDAAKAGKTNREKADYFIGKMHADATSFLTQAKNAGDGRGRAFDSSGDVAQAASHQYATIVRMLVYAWNNPLLNPAFDSKKSPTPVEVNAMAARDKLKALLKAIDNGAFAANPKSYDLYGTIEAVYTVIEGEAMMMDLTSGVMAIKSKTGKIFHKFFHHHDSAMRRRFLRKRVARDAARKFMAILNSGLNNQSGRAHYLTSKKAAEKKIVAAAKDLGNDARDHSIGLMIAQLKGLKNRFGYSYAEAFRHWYEDTIDGQGQLDQLDAAQKARYGDGVQRYLSADHLDIMRDTPMAKDIVSILEGTGIELLFRRYQYRSDQIRPEVEAQFVSKVEEIIKKLEKASQKSPEALHKYADAVESVMGDIGNAMQLALFYSSQERGDGKITKYWKEGGLDPSRQTYSSVPVRRSYASDPFADETKRSKREGTFVEDPADIMSFKEASFFSGRGKTSGIEKGKTVYRPLVSNGITAPLGMIDDALFRLNVTPSYEILRRVVGRAVEDRHGMQTVVDQDSGVMRLAEAMPEEWIDEHMSDVDSALSSVAYEMETIIKNATQVGVVNTGFAEAARFLSGAWIARALAAPIQWWQQGASPTFGVVAKKAIIGDWEAIQDFGSIFAREFPSVVQAFVAHRKAGSSDPQAGIFIDDLTLFIKRTDQFVFYRGHELTDDKSDILRKQTRTGKGKIKGLVGRGLKEYAAFGDTMLNVTIGAPERMLGRAIYVMEIRAELRRIGHPLAKMTVDEMIKRPDMIPRGVISYARTKVNDMLGQSDQEMKSFFFQSQDSSPLLSTFWKSITRFSNHTSSTGANLNTFAPVVWDVKVASRFQGREAFSKYDQDTYTEALENVTGTLVQNILFGIMKPKVLVPLLTTLFYWMGGDDDEDLDDAQRKGQELANKMLAVNEDDGVTLGNIAKAVILGSQRELFMESKDPEAARASAMAEILDVSLTETMPAIPLVGVAAGYFWGQKLFGGLVVEPASKSIASLVTGVDVARRGQFQDDVINIREYQPSALERLAEVAAPAAMVYDIGDTAARGARAGQTGEFNFAEIALYLAAEATPGLRELKSYYQKKVEDEIRLQGLRD